MRTKSQSSSRNGQPGRTPKRLVNLNPILYTMIATEDTKMEQDDPHSHLLAELFYAVLSSVTFGKSQCFHRFHSFTQEVDISSTQTPSLTFLCRRCHTHLEIIPDHTQKHNQEEPLAFCLTGESSHLFETTLLSKMDMAKKSNDQSSLETYAKCTKCDMGWRIGMSSPELSQEHLFTLKKGKDPGALSSIYFMLSFYATNAYIGQAKSINSENARFRDFIGVSPTSINLLSKMGYQLEGTVFQVRNVDDRHVFVKLLKELYLQHVLVNPDKHLPAIFKIQEATRSLFQLFGLQYPTQGTIDEVLKQWSDLLGSTRSSYMALGSLKGETKEKDIKETYLFLTTVFPERGPEYMDALISVATDKQSFDLEEFVMLERSKGMLSQAELNSAFEKLGASSKATLAELIEAFTLKYTANPGDTGELRDALQTIATGLKMDELELFLQTGEIVFSKNEPEALVPVTGIPCGIENIGNTCYLNALLQFYFSIVPIRDLILGFSIPTTLTEEQTKDEALSRSLSFLTLLKEFFQILITSEQRSVKVSKELAEITLARSIADSFGEQQDMHECMDSIVDMFDKVLEAFKIQGSPRTSLFQGLTKQQLSYRGNDGELKSTVKEEAFNHLILEVTDDLYTSLDAYFESQSVDFDGTTADRDLSIASFPPIIVLLINRARFDREKGQAFKDNQFMKYYPSLSLERYSQQRLSVSKQKRKEAQVLKKQLDELSRRHAELLQSMPMFEGGMDKDVADQVKATVEGLDSEMTSVKSKLDNVYSQMQGHEYDLGAVFFHEGDATFGHYWVYLPERDPGPLQKMDPPQTPPTKWYSFNDSIVQGVPESKVFGDTTGSFANAYALVYTRRADNIVLNRLANANELENVPTSLIQVFDRTKEAVESYRTRFSL